jgi:hypothetical protein
MTQAAQTRRGDADALPMETRLAPIASVDAEARTIEVVWTTGAKVRRSGWRSEGRFLYDESLVVTAAAIDLTRLNSGGPVLDSHDMYSTRSQVGVVERARVENGQGLALIRFAPAGLDPNIDALWGKIAAGIVRNLSCGYSRDEVAVTRSDKVGEVEQWSVTRWTPYELSFVTIPADAGAQTRSDAPAQRTFPVQFNRAAAHNQEGDMPEDQQAAVQADNTRAIPAQIDAQSVAEAVRLATAAERARSATITDIMTRAQFPQAEIATALAGNETVEQVRTRAFDRLAAADLRAAPISGVQILRDEGETTRTHVVEAMTHRFMGTRAANVPAEAARFMDYRLSDFAATVVGERNLPRNSTQMQQLFQRAFHVSSDFPNLFGSVINRTLGARYALMQMSYRTLSRQQDFRDFRQQNAVRTGDFPQLEQLPEGAEIKFGTFADKREPATLTTYARRLNITRQMLINDDLNAIASLLASYGSTVQLLEDRVSWALILSASGAGPTMNETGRALFNTTDKTLAASAAAIDEASLSIGRESIRTQVRVGGLDPRTGGGPGNVLGLPPAFLVVGPARETAAQKMVTQVVPGSAANTNVFVGTLSPLVSAQISGNGWYLFTDPALQAVFRWGLLEGSTGPSLTVENVFGADGVGVQAVHDFGFAAEDFRGAYRNAGA